MPNKTKTLVLLHGLRGDSHGLFDIAKEIPQDRYKVVIPDLPGYGETPELEQATPETYADWLHDFIKEQKLQKPIIIGHSMGSIVASAHLSKYPEDSAKKAILLSPIMRSKNNQRRNNATCALTIFGLKLLIPKLRNKLLKSHLVSFCISHVLTCDRSMQKYIDEQHYAYSENFSSARSLMNDIKMSMRCQACVPEGKELLFCIGNLDSIAEVKAVKETAKKHNIKYVELQNTGHLINYEQPKQVANAIIDFIEND